jgi:hypothetical protein
VIQEVLALLVLRGLVVLKGLGVNMDIQELKGLQGLLDKDVEALLAQLADLHNGRMFHRLVALGVFNIVL